jgi:hypothetical protein
MKKIFSLLSLMLPILFFSSCNSGGSGEVYTIKMRLNKGDKFVQHIKTNMEMNSMMKTSTEATSLFEVIKSDDAEKEIQLTFKKMDQQIDMNALKSMHQKNDSTMNIKQDSILNKMKNNFEGKSVFIKLNKDNHVTMVSGMDSMVNNSFIDSAQKQIIQKMFSKDQFNNLLGMMFDMYPKKPVRIGDNWTSETSMNMSGFAMKINNRYTLNSVKNGIGEIAIDGTVNSDGSMNKNTEGLKMNMSGGQKGIYTIKMETSYLQTGSYKMNMKIEMEILGKKMPMTMKGDYIMQAE